MASYKLIDNFLTSGFIFTKNELELKLKYHFFNMLLALNTLAVFIAGMFRFYQGEMAQSIVDFTYTAISIVIIFLVRINKEKFPIFVYLAVLVALVTVSLTFIINKNSNNFIGISWFYLEVLVVFFLTNKKFSISIILVSLIIIVTTMFVEMGIEGVKSIIFGLTPFLVFSLFASLYEDRNKIQTNLLKEQNELLEAYSYNIEHFDNLTNLPNRNLFVKDLHYQIQFAEKRDESFSLININLDDFKTINDSYGHSFGDKILIEVAQRLSKNLHLTNHLSRIGSDEFIILCKLTSSDELLKMASLIQKEIQKKFLIDDKSIFVTSSIGIVTYPKDGTIVTTLMQNIDSALHDAKKSARNSIRFYDEQLTKQTNEKLAMIAKLKHAIEYKELEVYYQPQIDATTNRLIGMEALVRWNHPVDGFISPVNFISLAEEYDLIQEIDYFVMQESMRNYLKFKAQYSDIGRLSINLSVKLLEMDRYLNDMLQIMGELNFNAHDLELEITESCIIHDMEYTGKILKKISSLGIRLAIDDFGTGYSSLSYLQQLPFNKLKIDRSFIINMLQREDDANLVKSIINIAKALNMSVIAEGVDAEDQKDFLVQNGCFQIQGYFYSQPLSAENFLQFINNLHNPK